MNLAALIKTNRNVLERTWNIASSEHWYNDDTFWIELITHNTIYKDAMIETGTKLIEKICKDIHDSQKTGAFVALGPGDGKKEMMMHAALGTEVYIPIDINKEELYLAEKSVLGKCKPIHAEFREGLQQVKNETPKFIYLGATYSNLDAIHYDLLAIIEACLQPEDSMYFSAQTFPCIADLPLLTHQYSNPQYFKLNQRMAQDIGAKIKEPFVQFNPTTKNLEVGAIISEVSGVAQEMSMQPGDKIITMTSHKPETLLLEVTKRFGTAYNIKSYQVQHLVPTPTRDYTSTFEGIILTRKAEQNH